MEQIQTIKKYKSKLGNPKGRLKYTIGEALQTQSYSVNSNANKKIKTLKNNDKDRDKHNGFTKWVKHNPLKAALFIPYTLGVYTPRKILNYISKKI